MRNLYSLLISISLLVCPVISSATPVEYSFEMTVTQLRTYDRPDPYYSNFFLGQKFYGTLTYDPSTAIQHDHGYHNVLSLWFQWDQTLVTTDYGYRAVDPDSATVTIVNVANGAVGGADELVVYEEWPILEGGYLANYVLDNFWFYFDDYEGTAIPGDELGALNFSEFDGGRWLISYFGHEGTYSPLYMTGSVGKLTPVPAPDTGALMGAALIALAAVGCSRRAPTRSSRRCWL